MRTVKDTVQPYASDYTYTLQPAFPTLEEVPTSGQQEKGISQEFVAVFARLKSVFEPSSSVEQALASHNVNHFLFDPRGKKVSLMHMLTAVSTQQTRAVISYLQELTLHQTIYLTVMSLGILGIYRLKFYSFTIFGLFSGLALIGVLLFSLSETRQKQGISTAAIVNIALMLTLLLVFLEQSESIEGPQDRLPIVLTCLGTQIVNHMVQHNSTVQSTISNILYRISLLVFNLKVETTFLEIAFQIFLYLCLVLQSNSQLSTQAYLQAYLQRYRQTIDANDHSRNLILQSLRDSISAIQLGSENSRPGEISDSHINGRQYLLSSSLASSIPNATNKSFVNHIKNVAQLLNCLDLITRHQFLEMDKECIIETEHSRHRERLTPAVLNNEQLYSVNPLSMLKGILRMYQDVVIQNRKTVSMFLIESQHKVPLQLMLSREAVGAILTNLLANAIPTSKKNNISIYVSWLPNQPVNEAVVDRTAGQVEPIFVLPSSSTDSSYSVSQQIEQKMAMLASSDPYERFFNGVRQKGEWLQNQQMLQGSDPRLQEGFEYEPMLHHSQLQPFLSQRSRRSDDLKSIGMLGSNLQMSSINGGSQQPYYKNSISSFSDQLSQPTLNDVGMSRLQCYRVHSQENLSHDEFFMGSNPNQRNNSSQNAMNLSKNQPLQSSAGRSKEMYSNRSLEKLLRKIDDIESLKRRQSENNGVMSGQLGFMQRPINRESVSNASSLSDLNLDFDRPHEVREKWYNQISGGRFGHNLSRVSEYSRENVKSSQSQKKEIQDQSQNGDKLPSIRGSIDNENLVPNESQWSGSAQKFKSNDSNLQQKMLKLSLEKDLVKAKRKVPVPKHQSQQDMNQNLLLDEVEEEKVPLNSKSDSNRSIKKQEIKIVPQQRRESLKAEDLDDYDLEMEIPDEDCEVPLDHTFLSSCANTEMRQGKNSSKITYVFVGEDEKQSEASIHRELSVPMQSQASNNNVVVGNPIFEEEKKSSRQSQSCRIKKNKESMGSCGETPDAFSQSSDGSRMHFQYQYSAMQSQSHQSHPLQPDQNSDPPMQVSLEVGLLSVEEQPIQKEKSKFSMQDAIEELKESSSDQRESNMSFQEENLSAKSFFQNHESEASPNQKMVMSARIVDKEVVQDPVLAEEAKVAQVDTPRVQTPKEQNQFLSFDQDLGGMQKQKEDVKNIDKGFSFGEPNSSQHQQEDRPELKMQDHAQMLGLIQSQMQRLFEETKQRRPLIDPSMPDNFTDYKIIEVRTLKRGRSKSIVVPGVTQEAPRGAQRISRLNNYNPALKKHRGSISIGSDLDSIEEEKSSKRGKGDTINSSEPFAENLQSSKKGNEQKVNQLNSSMLGSELSKSGSSFGNYKFGVIQNSLASKEDSSKNLEESKASISPPADVGSQQSSPSERPRSNSIGKSIFVGNYGHGRRSNLKKKANQISRLNRSKSVVAGTVDQNRLKEQIQQSALASGDHLTNLRASHNISVSRVDSSLDSGVSGVQAKVREQNGSDQASPAVQTMMQQMRLIKNQFDFNQSMQSNSLLDGSIHSLKDPAEKAADQSSFFGEKLSSRRMEVNPGFTREELIQEERLLVKKHSTMMNIPKIVPQQTSLRFETEGTSNSSILQSPNLLNTQKNDIKASISMRGRDEKFDNYYSKLMSLVEHEGTSSQSAVEIAQILQGWGKQTFMPQPDSGAVFDGVLQIQIYDLPPCKLQFSTKKSQNIADVAATLSNQSQCGDTDCNRCVANRLLRGTMKLPKWTDITKLDEKRTQLTPQLELCRQLADLIGVEVLMQQKKDSLGAQFCVRIPVASVPGQDS